MPGSLHRLMALAVCLTMLMAATALSALEAEDEIPSSTISHALFLDGAAIGGHMLVVGERGRILVSDDGGRSWTRADVPTRATLTGVSLIDGSHGWAVGHDAVILRTRDGGLTWESVFAAPEEERPLLDVWFENTQHGIAVGAYGLVLETRDGGDTWKRRDIGAGDRHLNQISAASSKQLYVVGEAGSVYRSDDGGHSWQRQDVPYTGSFFGALPLDERRIYVFGLRGHLFYSDDAGARWRALDTRTQSLLTNGIQIDGNGVLIAGMDGILLSIENHDASVTAIQRSDRMGIAGALNAPDGALVVFGEFGVDRMSGKQLEPLQ